MLTPRVRLTGGYPCDFLLRSKLAQIRPEKDVALALRMTGGDKAAERFFALLTMGG